MQLISWKFLEDIYLNEVTVNVLFQTFAKLHQAYRGSILSRTREVSPVSMVIPRYLTLLLHGMSVDVVLFVLVFNWRKGFCRYGKILVLRSA